MEGLPVCGRGNNKVSDLKSFIKAAQQRSEQSAAAVPIEATMPLQDIKNRPGGDTRSLNPEHVQTLAESIGAVGLVQPIAVDNQGRLLAGGHRRAAIELLNEQNLDAYTQHFKGDRVPVKVFDFDAEKESERALAIEVVENEQRRDYTAAEARAIATKLRDAGYVDRSGPVREEEKRLRPALQLIIGKSERTIRRWLNEGEDGQEEKRPSGRFERDKHLKRAIAALKRWEAAEPVDDDEQRLLGQVKGMIKKLERGISKHTE